MTTKYTIFITILLLCSLGYGAPRKKPKTPKARPETTESANPSELDKLQNTPTPSEKPIEVSTTEEGETESTTVEISRRSDFIYPSNWGQAGLFRIRSAESLPEGALAFGIGGEFYSISDAPNFGYGNLKANTIAENLFVGYAPTPKLTLSVQRRNSSTTFGEPQRLISSLGDFNFSALYSLEVTPDLTLSPIGNFLIASNFNDLAPSGTTLSAGLGVASTLGFFKSSNLPLFLHANVLYHMPQLRTTKSGPLDPEAYFNFSRYHTFTLGLGVEFKIQNFIPFMEFIHTAHTNSTLGFGRSPSKLTVGARITPLNNKSLAVLLGADVGINRSVTSGVPFSPGYQVIGQVSYTFGLHTTERKHYYTTKDVNVVDRKFVIKKRINFKVGKADLLSSSYALLDEIADVIKKNEVKKLLIAGHTDSTANEDFNLRLSLARANAVKSYLISQGVGEEILTTQGYGKRKPMASNATEAGRRENRRVEFFILE
ncbi:MAG: OmpA family protein [Deltaproteobacteria bacterium]|nr:OmpA family protein [Deltaproteobacteria bacterium]